MGDTVVYTESRFRPARLLRFKIDPVGCIQPRVGQTRAGPPSQYLVLNLPTIVSYQTIWKNTTVGFNSL